MGKTLAFGNATVEDSAFILSLRADTEKSRHLSPGSGERSDQQGSLERYAAADHQAYFIIEYHDEPIGTVRLNDAQVDSFYWVSWMLKEGRPSQARWSRRSGVCVRRRSPRVPRSASRRAQGQRKGVAVSRAFRRGANGRNRERPFLPT